MTTLNQVAESFTHWRSTRNKRGHTPPHLIDQAVSLVGQYTKSQIIKRLGINNTMLDLWIKARKPIEAPDFIELKPLSSITTTPNNTLAVSVELSSGSVLKLSGESNQMITLLLALREGALL